MRWPVASSDLLPENRRDELLGNVMQWSEMIVVAVRPILGKSALVFNIALAAQENGNRVGIFSLEMSRDQIALRLLASEAGVDSYRVRIGLLTAEEETRLVDARGALSGLVNDIYSDRSCCLIRLCYRNFCSF